MDPVLEWARARARLLAALSDTTTWLKPGKGGVTEAVSPPPLAELWQDLARAEAALFATVADRV